MKSTRRLPTSGCAALLLGAFFAGSPLVAGEVELTLVSGLAFAPGDAANHHSFPRAASPDGRFLLIDSQSNNLVSGVIDVNAAPDVFVLDRQEGSLDLVSRRAGLPERTAGLESRGIAISSDGRWVLFESRARDLIAGASYPGETHYRQVFLFDRSSRTVQLVSRSLAAATTAGRGEAVAGGLSADGRYALFIAKGGDLGNGIHDQIYLFDRDSGTHRLVSRAVSGPGTQGNGTCESGSLSPDGRFVFFSSASTNLVAGQLDAANSQDAFLFDRDSGTIELISRHAADPLQAAGGRAMDLTADGRFLLLLSRGVSLVAGVADGNGSDEDAFLLDRQSGQMRLITASAALAGQSADNASLASSVSQDGRFVYLISQARDLVSGFTDRNGIDFDVYLFDAASGGMQLVSRRAGSPNAGAEAGVVLRSGRQNVSPDGRYALLETAAGDLDAGAVDENAGIDTYLYDRTRGTSTLVSRFAGSAVAGSAPFYQSDVLLADGQVFFASGAALDPDLAEPRNNAHVFHFEGEEVELVRAAAASGRTTLAFSGRATFGQNPRHVVWGPYLYDHLTGANEIVGHPAGHPAVAFESTVGRAVTADGRHVLYESSSAGMAAGVTDSNGATDVFLYDRTTQAATLLTHAAGSPQVAALGASGEARLSPEGRFVAFDSSAADLVAGMAAQDGGRNVFVYDRTLGTTSLASHAAGSPIAGGDGLSTLRALGSGGWVVYRSEAGDLVPGFVDRNGALPDLYYYDRATAQNRLITRRAGTLAEGSARTEYTFSPVLLGTSDGASIFYTSSADDLVAGQVALPGEQKIFRWDRATGANHLVVHLPGQPESPCSGSVRLADISADGRFVLFDGTCRLVPGDTNDQSDVYLLDRGSGQIVLISHAPGQPGLPLEAYFRAAQVSEDGRRIVYLKDDAPYSYDRASGEATLLAFAYYDPLEAGHAEHNFLTASPDGSRVLFSTFDARLTPFDPHPSRDSYLAVLAEVFGDGFESGDTAAWSSTLP